MSTINSANPKIKGILIRMVCLLFLLVCLFLPFANGMTMTVESTSDKVITTYRSAFAFMFGGKLISEHITYPTRGISIVLLLSYVFLVVSIAAAALSFFFAKQRRKTAALLVAISVLFGLVSSIMAFSCQPEMARVLADAIIGGHSDSVTKTITERTKLGFGVLGFGIFELIATIGQAASLFVDGTYAYFKAAVSK